MKLVLFFFLVLASSSLLVNAEYRWDQDAQEWVLVEDVSVVFDNLIMVLQGIQGTKERVATRAKINL